MILRKELRTKNVRVGFTLMEMLVVVAILVVLAGAAVPIYMNRLDEARVDTTRLNVKTIASSLEMYRLKYGDYPASLADLVQPPDGSKAYLEPSALIDQWNHEYQYQAQGTHNAALGKPDVWSLGPKMNDPNGIIGNWTAAQGGVGGQ